MSIKEFVKTYLPFEKSNLRIKALDYMGQSRFQIILNSEETDILDSYVVFLMYYIVTNKNKNVVVSGTRYSNCQYVLDSLLLRFKYMKEYFSDAILMTNKNSYNRTLNFSNGCHVEIKGVHRHSKVLDDNVDFVILMDMADSTPLGTELFYKSCFINLINKPDSKMIINSSPNGKNYFYDLYKDAYEGNSIFKTNKLHFWLNEEVNEKWVEERIKKFGEDHFHARYNLHFFNTSNNKKHKYS